MYKSIFNLLLIVGLSISAVAQTEAKKKTTSDTVKNKFLPTGLRVGTDIVALIKSKDSDYKGWELNFDTDFSRYYFTVDI
jgi:Domain of unknown function (DUF6048)